MLETVVAEDFNGDGKPDLVGAFVPFDAYSMDLGLLLNSGVGFLPPTETVAPRDQAFGSFYVAAGDFNGDGKMDIAEVFDELSILLGKGDGTFQPAVQYRAGMSGPIAVGDFNNDGKLDIVGGSSTGLSLLLGNGDGTFGFPVNSPGGSPGAVADFNRDGKLDVATLGGQILFGNGDGTFSAGPTYNAGFAIASGDLNGDSIPDIVVATLYGVDTASSVLILLGNGDGTFQSPTATKVGNGINSIAIGDFNLDGKADVVVSNTGWSDVSLLLGNGDGTLQPPVEFAVGGDFNPGGLAVSDFDGNGSLDLAVASTANIFVLLNTAGSHTHAALLSADALAFEAEKGQTTSPQAVTLSYMASSALTIKGITISGPQSGDFEQTNNCGTSLAAIGNCTISVTFTPQTVGARAAAIQITNNAFNSPQVIRLSGTGTAPPSIGFTVPSGGSNFATVTAGQPANYTLSIGGAGMTGSATFTCNGAPRGATCVVPSSVGVSDTSTSTVYVAVSTTSRTMASVNSRGMIRFGGVWAAFLLGLVLVPAARRKRPSSGLYLGALVASLMLIASCGGSSSGPNTNPNGTPAGTYKLTVTATLNSTTEDVTLQLIVQ